MSNPQGFVLGRNEECHWLRQGEIPGLDGIRAVAVLLVVLAHVSRTSGFPWMEWVAPVASQGAIGVDIFFVLSGFLITTLLIREERANGRISLKGFYARRIRRIVPAYVFYLFVLAVLCAIGALTLTRSDWLSAATYTVNYIRSPSWEVGHIWSLSIEEHFYILWPFTLVVVGFTRSAAVLIWVLLGAAAIRWAVLLFVPQYSAMTDLWTFTRIDTIAAGCLLAILAQDESWRIRLHSVSNKAYTTVLLLGLLIASLFLSQSGKYAVGLAPTANAILIACLLWVAITRAARGQWLVLSSSMMVTLGVMSYSIYLWQQLFLNPRVERWINSFPQNIVLAFLAACCSYRFVESRFRKKKPHISASRTNTNRAKDVAHADYSADGGAESLEPVRLNV